ncbi:HupE/UreJ family protein [Cellulomonas sp. ICMP 17802]|uniref:HupE/UreJ family protein n=1 Tax=Cellulomonas sp. ICMP 17802 TaxID=3239199 RepID=UPI00351B8CB3
MRHGVRRTVLALLALLATAAAVTAGATAVSAHGFSSTVYVDVTAAGRGHVRTEIGLEYDLLVVSAADAQDDDPLFQDGTAAFEDGDPADQAAALAAHAGSVLAYVTERLTVASADRTCLPTQVGDVTVTQREGVPYAVLVLDHACTQPDGAHQVTSTLFGDAEGYVTGAKTIVTYEVDGQHGSAALDGEHPSFSTEQTWTQRFSEFFLLGAEHLLTGLDHILFLLALIAGSRRLREIVLAATAFTLAHSLTFVLAATGLVAVPTQVVEPVIALSIAVVAGWYLWRVWRHGEDATDPDVLGRGHLSLDRAGWFRLGVVFCFGLVHGLGFAGALGIDEPWSWTLLWSLLVFNLGIEAVQLTLIALVFPVLALLRRHAPRLGLWATGSIASAVAAIGVVWFVERVIGA